jgi:hypothetical protein
MNLSPLIRFGKSLLACSVASALPVLSFGQAVFVTNGGQYALSGVLPGDQVHAAASINPTGGYLVWEDNSIDGSGQGIAAAALDSNFSFASPRFRVNQIRKGDQEYPQVSLLKDGGAVFVWQSRPMKSARHIFARFLSASNSWATGDILASSFTANFQINPVVTTLANGNVVIAYGSFNQATPTSMQDVYAQIFSPSGQKIGSEILVNQTTDWNQRTPSIAPLSDGRFAVAWVSELQSHDNSVEIFARVFTAEGVAATDERPVSTTTVNVCANPSVAALANGGFVVAWDEKDHFVRNNGWDIFGRGFDSNSAPFSSVQMLNTNRFGDQIAPRVAALDNGAVAVWTSLGQDGSQEGVYGRFLDANGATNGATSSSEFRVNTTTLSRQIHPVVASDGNARFLAAWSSFAGASSGLDLFGQRLAKYDYLTVQSTTNYAAPAIDPYPSDEGTIAGSILPPDPGNTQLTPTFTNSLASVSGTYSGLFYDRTNGVSLSSAGYFTVVTTTKGTYSAKASFGGRTYTFSGGFNNAGHATALISRGVARPLTVQLQLMDGASGEQLRGTLTDGNWISDLAGNLSVYDKSQNPAGAADNYVMRLPGDTQSASSPGGDSFGSVKVDASGNVVWSGSLSDGTKVTQKSALSAQGTWPLYVSLYGGKGCVMGWIQFTNNGLSGSVVWMKSGGTAGKYYPSGFTNQLEASGIPYRPPALGTRLLDLSDGAGKLMLSGGGLGTPASNSLKLELNNKVTDLSGNKLSLILTPTSGLFHGSVLNPDTGKPITFQGALFPDWNVGLGYFLTPNQSGQVYLAPAQ